MKDRTAQMQVSCEGEATDARHELWLIYVQLKDAESDSVRRLELLQQSREDLGRVLNAMARHDEER
jgi:hypothetical protein